MDITLRDQFDTQWERFLTTLEGKIISHSANHPITCPHLNILLREARLCWESDYETAGRWLKKVKAQYPEQGKLIHQILLRDMIFQEIPEKAGSSELWNLLIPVAGAITGLTVSSLLHASTLVRVLSTVAPAGLLYGAMKVANPKAAQKQRLTEDYFAQLETYRQSVCSILEQLPD